MKELDPLVLREIAGYVAPILRSASPAAVARRVKVYRQDTGEVTGETTIGEALRGLAEVYGLEHAVEGPAKTTPCKRCGRPLQLSKYRRTNRACPVGKGCNRLTCPCGVVCQSSCAMTPAAVAKRNGEPWRCLACSRISHAKKAGEARRCEQAKELGRALTRKERKARITARKKAAKAAAAGGST